MNNKCIYQRNIIMEIIVNDRKGKELERLQVKEKDLTVKGIKEMFKKRIII